MSDHPQAPEPHTDRQRPEGPGGVDSVADWEAVEPDPQIPDPPRSAQVVAEEVPEEIEQPEEMDESDGAGSHPEDRSKDPAEDGKETLTEPGDDPDKETTA